MPHLSQICSVLNVTLATPEVVPSSTVDTPPVLPPPLLTVISVPELIALPVTLDMPFLPPVQLVLLSPLTPTVELWELVILTAVLVTSVMSST